MHQMSSFGMRTNLELCVYIGANINRGYKMVLKYVLVLSFHFFG